MDGSENRQPWQQLDTESDRAYAAFLRFRDAGRHRALRHAVGRERGERSTGRVQLWAKVHDWRRRVRAWDESISLAADQRVADELAAALAARRAPVARAIAGLDVDLADLLEDLSDDTVDPAAGAEDVDDVIEVLGRWAAQRDGDGAGGRSLETQPRAGLPGPP